MTSGILVIDKQENVTSRDVVNQVGKIFHTKKVGHTGTLDPLATGVLVLCIGEATKLVEILTSTEKSYIATVTLGIETDTFDKTGTVVKQEEKEITEAEIDATLSRFIGTYMQEVPLYSAIKVQGKKLYQYAREKKEVVLPKREVVIYELYRTSPLEKKEGFYQFSFFTRVSKGTYIRSLIRDLAHALHTVGIMSALRRVQQGDFQIKDAHLLPAIQKHDIIPIEEVLKKYPKKIVDSTLLKKVQNGSLLPKEKEDVVLFCDEAGHILALYKTYEKEPTLLKPWKMFKEEIE